MNYKKDTQKGKYNLIYPEKYLGSKMPIYKSKWEKKIFYAMDKNPYILKWGYECIDIYYYNPIYGRYTIYYPDVFCHVQTEKGTVEQLLLEIKPAHMCSMPKEPTIPKNKTSQSSQRYQKSLQAYQGKVRDYAINMAKWEAAQRWCLRHKVRWNIISENNTSGLFREGT